MEIDFHSCLRPEHGLGAAYGTLSDLHGALSHINFWGGELSSSVFQRSSVGLCLARMENYRHPYELWAAHRRRPWPGGRLRYDDMVEVLRRTGWQYRWTRFEAFDRLREHFLLGTGRPRCAHTYLVFYRRGGRCHCVNLEYDPYGRYDYRGEHEWSRHWRFRDYHRGYGDYHEMVLSEVSESDQIVVMGRDGVVEGGSRSVERLYEEWRGRGARYSCRREVVIYVRRHGGHHHHHHRYHGDYDNRGYWDYRDQYRDYRDGYRDYYDRCHHHDHHHHHRRHHSGYHEYRYY